MANVTVSDNSTNGSLGGDDGGGSGGFQNWHGDLQPLAHYQAALWLDANKYYILAPFAVIGNLLCIAVLGKRIFTKPTYMLMANMAIWDMLVILMKMVYQLIHFNEVLIGDSGCVALGYWVDMSPCIAVWLMCAVTLDRTLLVWRPLVYRKHITVKAAVGVVIFICVAMFLVNVPHIWLNVMRHHPPFVDCTFRSGIPQADLMHIVWAYLSSLNFAPSILLILLNILVVVRAVRVLKAAREERPDLHTKHAAAEMHITAMAVTVSVTFVLLTLPASVFVAFRTFLWEYWLTKEDFLLQQQLYTATFFLYDLNHCANVFLYFVASRRFRADMGSLFHCGRQGRAEITVTDGASLHTFTPTTMSATTD